MRTIWHVHEGNRRAYVVLFHLEYHRSRNYFVWTVFENARHWLVAMHYEVPSREKFLSLTKSPENAKPVSKVPDSEGGDVWV